VATFATGQHRKGNPAVALGAVLPLEDVRHLDLRVAVREEPGVALLAVEPLGVLRVWKEGVESGPGKKKSNPNLNGAGSDDAGSPGRLLRGRMIPRSSAATQSMLPA
jgi:hypothetical protein